MSSLPLSRYRYLRYLTMLADKRPSGQPKHHIRSSFQQKHPSFLLGEYRNFAETLMYGEGFLLLFFTVYVIQCTSARTSVMQLAGVQLNYLSCETNSVEGRGVGSRFLFLHLRQAERTRSKFINQQQAKRGTSNYLEPFYKIQHFFFKTFQRQIFFFFPCYGEILYGVQRAIHCFPE